MTTTYAQRAQTTPQIQYPKKETSIILNALPNIPINNYILALAEIIDPSKILYAAKMSNNRICICLQTKTDADFITNNYKTIKINNQEILIRKFLTPSQRLVVWVFPSVTNETIIDLLKSKGVNPISNMYFMSAGINDARLSHIKSFHRYVYIHEDHPPIPETTSIIFENEPYQIYLSIDEKKCGGCGRFGHDLEKCRKNPEPGTSTIIEIKPQNETETKLTTPPNIQSTPLPSTEFLKPSEAPPVQKTPSTSDICPTQNIPTSDKPKKRILSNGNDSENDIPHKQIVVEPESEESEDSSVDLEFQNNPNQTEKKRTLADMIEILKEPMDREADKYIFNYETLTQFINDTKGISRIQHIIDKYDLIDEHIINTLETLRPILKDPQAKSGFTKLIKKIQKSKQE